MRVKTVINLVELLVSLQGKNIFSKKTLARSI